jgi:ABC-type multidrug transport system fused ATPase/permease subunit
MRFSIVKPNSTFSRAVGVLSKLDKRKLIFITVIQILLGMMDLLGVLAIGLLGTLSITGIQSNQPGSKVSTVLELLGLSNATFQTQALFIGTAAVLLLIGRTVLSIIFTRRILYFMSYRGAAISANLVSRFLAQPLLVIQRWSVQQALFAVTRGVEIVALEVLALSVVLIADIALLVVLLTGLFIVDPITSIGTIIIFGVIALILYKLMHQRAEKIGFGTKAWSSKNGRGNSSCVANGRHPGIFWTSESDRQSLRRPVEELART